MIKSEETEDQIKKNKSSLKTAFLISILLIVIVITFFVYESISKPREATIKNFASQYSGLAGKEVPESEIKIIGNYNKDGKIYYILQVGENVCDMSMIKIEGTWNALGISCK
uniref:hypothetical protein n=1 Tax=Aliarcobacter sp. TaxID=2321116 RepID=UPI0040481D18